MQSSLYKTLAALTGLVLCTHLIHAQPRPVPQSYTFPRNNFVRTWTATSPVQDANSIMSMPLADVKQATEYYDGLGRTLQSVAKKGSVNTATGDVKDMVTAVEYDEYGREQFKYLPFVANNEGGNTSLNDGLFKLNPFKQQETFYSNPNGVLKGQNETWFYGVDNLEASPASRILETYAPGNSWAGTQNATTQRNITVQYLHNEADEQVRIWAVSGSSFSSAGTYSAGLLQKLVTTDEHKNKSIEYKDKSGKVILKKLQLSATPSANHTGWLCTYYVYDEYEQLRGVLQPRAVELLAAGSWTLTNDILNELCFRYEYDERGRMIIKKVPGAGEVYMVYDARDRLVLTQDANLRATDKWVYTKYDELNRPIVTGFYTGASGYTQQQMANAVKTSGLALYESRNSSTFVGYTLNQSFPVTTSADVLTITYYDDYGWSGWFGSQYGAKDNTYDYLFSSAYTTPPYPQPLTQTTHTRGLVTGTWIKILSTTSGLVTANFYDDKGKLIQTKSSNQFNGTDILTMQYSFSGLLLQSILYQDKPGTNSQNHRIITKMQYDDLGRLLNVKKSVLSNINGNQITKPEIEIVKNEYDALGRLKTKTIGKKIDDNGNYTTTPVETMEYDYNIRGWTLGMNRTYAKTTGSSSNYFGFDLGYDKQDIKNGSGSSIGSFSAAAFNGNITGMLWKGVGDGKLRKYDFTYDAVNRLTGADFKEHTGSQFSLNDIDFSVSNLSYDANGNILTMQQKGWKITGSTTIDDLRYHYRLNGTSNQLQNVIDMTNDVNTKLGDFRTSSNHTQLADKSSYVASPGSVNAYNITDYVYDANGNMIKDYNKDIGNSSNSGITYNHLNLPQTILLRNSDGSVKGAVDYVYNAAGIKLKKIVTDYQSNKTITTTTNYLNGFVYESRSFVQNSQTTVEYTDVLQFMPQEEGRIRFEKATTATCIAKPDRLLYDYFITDHLGNVRMVLTEQNESICYIAATIEDARRTAESQIYDIQTARVTGIGQVNGASSYSQFEQQLYKVHGGVSGQKTGLGMVLKVMAGDVVKITGESIYDLPSAGAGSPATLALTELLTSFIGASPLAGKGITTTNISNAQGGGTGLLDFINNNPAPSNRAKAFINWILFDEQFKFVAGDVDPVNDNGGYKLHSKFINNPVVAGKSGYLYVYVSNESNFSVFFDNLVVTHKPGAVLEETSYYPFGLTMAGMSNKALKSDYAENKKKFNGIEHTTDLDLNYYDAFYRGLDPQIGRWLEIDPKIRDDESPYASMRNNPALWNDPLGDSTPDPRSTKQGIINGLKKFGKGIVSSAFPIFTGLEFLQQAKNDPEGAVNTAIQTAYPQVKLRQDAIVFIKGDAQARAEITTEYALNGFSLFLGARTTASPRVAVSSEEFITLFRGVNESHVGYKNALEGIAIPRGGAATALEHNLGNTNSPLTSWSTNFDVATNYALRPDGTGVVLKISVPKTTVVKSPSLKSINLKQAPGTIVNESEVFIKGLIKADQIIKL